MPLGDVPLLLQWLMWIVCAICLASFLVAAGKIGLALRSGGEYEGLRALVLTAAVSVLAASAALIANAVI